jgi:acetate kinase
MNILVVNIGSTSFKFRLFDMRDERVLARGGVEDVGQPVSGTTLACGDAEPRTTQQPIRDQAAAVDWCLTALAQAGAGRTALPIDAVGFKAIHGGRLADAVRVTPDVLAVMEDFAAAAPAHNPVYVAVMRAFAARMPGVPLVAAFETAFHQTIPASRTTFAIPYEWTAEHGVRRYGFHGASHQYIAERTAELLGRTDLRIISCHLGGSSSLCAIHSGRSVANSFGMTPQSGLPHNNRVGDFDAYALLVLRAKTGLDFDGLLAAMASCGGLLGISGLSNDMRQICDAAAGGHERAELALSTFVESVRHYLGAYVVALGGLDVLVFTGGIGERSAEVRRRVCAGLDFLGIRLDAERNAHPRPATALSVEGAPVRILVVPANEELMVARRAQRALR